MIAGQAGVGKSWVAKHLKGVLRFATTGTAAVVVGGRTIHSFLCKIKTIEKDAFSSIYGQNCTILIDEMSMLSADLFDTIMKRKAFLGFNIILVGDMLQIKPVKAGYFFQSDQFPELLKTCVRVDLTINKR